MKMKLFEGFIDDRNKFKIKLRNKAEKLINDFFKKYSLDTFLFLIETPDFSIDNVYRSSEGDIRFEVYIKNTKNNNKRSGHYDYKLSELDEDMLFIFCDKLNELKSESIIELIIISGQIKSATKFIKMNPDVEFEDWYIAQLYEINDDLEDGYDELEIVLFDRDPERYIIEFIKAGIEISDVIKKKYKKYQYLFIANIAGLL